MAENLRPATRRDLSLFSAAVCDRLLSGYVDAGYCFTYSGLPMLVGVSADPIVCRNQLYFVYLDPDLATSTSLPLIVDEVGTHFGVASTALLRCPPSHTFWTDSIEWKESIRPCTYYFSWKGLVCPSCLVTPFPEDFEIRPASKEDRTAIVPMLVRAFIRGYQLRREEFVAVTERTRQLMCDDSIERPDCVALIGRSGDVVGHATWQVSEDELTGTPLWDLLDIDTLPAFSGRGFATLLEGYVRDLAYSSGVTLRGSVKVEECLSAAHRLSGSLLSRGWTHAHDVWAYRGFSGSPVG